VKFGTMEGTCCTKFYFGISIYWVFGPKNTKNRKICKICRPYWATSLLGKICAVYARFPSVIKCFELEAISKIFPKYAESPSGKLLVGSDKVCDTKMVRKCSIRTQRLVAIFCRTEAGD